MPPDPGRVSETCAVTPSRRSCNVSRKPVFIESAITNVATPAATPTTEKSVTKRKTAGRYGDLRYRRATNHSNGIVETYSDFTEAVASPSALASGPCGRSKGK